jgi:hypothetical protein
VPASPNYLGTATGNTGIPSLLVSSLQTVTDPDVKTALYQIQNWANSFKALAQSGAPGAVLVGAYSGQAQIDQAGTLVGTTSGAGALALTFPAPFPNGVISVSGFNGDISAASNVTIGGSETATPTNTAEYIFYVTDAATGSLVTGVDVRINWMAKGF